MRIKNIYIYGLGTLLIFFLCDGGGALVLRVSLMHFRVFS